MSFCFYLIKLLYIFYTHIYIHYHIIYYHVLSEKRMLSCAAKLLPESFFCANMKKSCLCNTHTHTVALTIQ